MALEEFNHFFQEAKLTTKKRNDLDDSEFGIPELRKYPLYDKQHVLSAVTYFGKAEAKYKPELARRIVKRAKELDIEWYQWFDPGKSMSGYLKDLSKSDQNAYKNHSQKSEPIKESDESDVHVSDTPEARDIATKFAKAGITYDDSMNWKLKSPDEIFDKQKANCHDSSYYVYKQLHPKYPCGLLFFIEYNPDTNECGMTHTVCYEKIHDGVVAIELSYEDYGIGTFPFRSVKELAESYAHTWDFDTRYNSLLCLDVTDINGIHPGMTLDEYVKYVVSHSKYIFDTSVKESFVPDDLTSGTSDFDNDDDEPDDCYTESNKERVNDKGEKVPEKCNKCGSPIKVYLQGEPIYQCSNKKCKKYFGTLPCNINESAMSNKEYSKLKTDITDILGKLPMEYHQMLFSYQSSGFIKINRTYVLLDSFNGKQIDDNISIKKLYNPEELYESLIKDEHESGMYKIGTLNPSGYIYYKPSDQKFYIDKNHKRVDVGTDKDLFVKMIKESAYSNGLTNAKLIAARIHEKYEADKKPPTGNQNCQLCVWCAEAQFRGRTDMPRPVYSPRDPVLNITGESIVIHPRVFSMKAGFDDVLDILADRPYARFYCHAKWKEGHGGHEFLIITEDEYKCYIMDPQQGTVDKFLETHPYIKDIKWEDSYLARLDDAEYNESILKKYNTMDSYVPWDAKLDIPFMLKEGMITEEEAEQYWKEHPNETSNDRHFLSYEELDRISESKNIFTSGDFAKYGKNVDLTDARGPIQESAWNDIKNGVNPYSKKLWFHVSRSDKHEGKVFTPRVPGYLTNTKFGKDDPYYEDMKIPRVCFSPSIEGAIHAITSQGDRIGTGGEEMYVYIPEKPIEEYKHITNKEIVDKKLVFDAKYTKECWITEPVKLILYGTIMIDQVYNHRAKPTANKQADVGVVSYKWHWQTKPQVIKSMGHEVFAWNDDKEKQHQKNNKQNNKQIKEEYSMDMFERDPSILKMIMESENDSEDNNTKPEGEGIDELDITIDDDGDGDAINIGIDDSNEQNQYDPKEVETLNKLIASEADAISDYFEAGKATRVPVLSKLYSDIGEEERFHIEQLLYAKSTVTGEKYEPRDPKVREEYNELLSMGMDEETAMTTAVDKLSISISDEDELSDNEIEDIKEGFDMIANMSRFTSLTYDVILDAIADESDIKTSMYTEYMNIIEEAFVMEEVDNLNRPGTAREAKGKSIVKTVLGAFRALLNLVSSLTRKAKLAFTKIRLKDKRRWAWIKKHGIKALFQEGVSMFFWSDKRNRYEVGQAFTFLQIIHVMNAKIIKDCKINVNISQFEINDFIRKLSNITKAPDDSNELINRIMNANIAEGVKTLNGMVLSKTKVLVTEENEAYLEQLFFGYTNDKYNMVMAADDGSQKNVDLSQNIYNQLDILLSALERVSKETGLVLEALDKMEGQGGVYASNPKLYNTCVQALSVMTKSTNKFISAVSNDISAAFKLNKGLKELVDQADQATNNTEKTEALKNVNQYQADQAQANQERQAEANKTKAQENTTKYGARTI